MPPSPSATPGTAGLAEAVVDLDAIRHNVLVLSKASAGELMAVVKANGFGHGAVQVARTALDAGASWLGVASLAEACELRGAGIDAPILAWLYLPGDDLSSALCADVDLSVSTAEQLRAVAGAAASVGRTANVHLKIDTGMHRAGASPRCWAALVDEASRLEATGAARVGGLWTHLARADEPEATTTDRQCDAFDRATDVARERGLRPDVLHVANSAAVLGSPRAHYTLARAGIAVYGVEPIPGRTHGLVPAMTLTARILQTCRVESGAGVSYGHEYVTDHASTLALVPLGFADGVPRAASGRAQVQVHGARVAVAGRIAMDQFVVDVGDERVEAGDAALVFGPGRAGEPTVTDWARWAGTNEHEVLTGVGPRVSRRYVERGCAPDRTRVAVVFGGVSDEHEVSCASGAAVVTALDEARYDVVTAFVSREGRWTMSSGAAGTALVDGSVAEACSLLREVDVVFPVLHGPMGEDGTLQGMLATLGLPYVGSGVLASAVGMDKAVTKDLLRAHGIAVSPGVVLRPDDAGLDAGQRQAVGLPAVVKPARAGSSQGVSRIDDWDDLDAAIELARRHDVKVLVEPFVAGREVDVALLEHPDGTVLAGPPLEITYAAGHQVFDYDAKYSDHEGTRFVVPARTDPAATDRLQAIARRVFAVLGCGGLLRVDFLLGDERGDPVVNEVNTIPGFTAMSQFPQIWGRAGVPYPELLDTLIATALARSRSASTTAATPRAAHL